MYRCKVEDCVYKDLGLKQSLRGSCWIAVVDHVNALRERAKLQMNFFIKSLDNNEILIPLPPCRDLANWEPHVPRILFETSECDFAFGCSDKACHALYVAAAQNTWIIKAVQEIEDDYRRQIKKYLAVFEEFSLGHFLPFAVHFEYTEVTNPSEYWRTDTFYARNVPVTFLLKKMMDRNCYNFRLAESSGRPSWCPAHGWPQPPQGIHHNNDADDGDDADDADDEGLNMAVLAARLDEIRRLHRRARRSSI